MIYIIKNKNFQLVLKLKWKKFVVLHSIQFYFLIFLLKDIYLQTLEKLKKSAVREQIVAGRKFNGVSFKSQPRLIHFKVISF